VSTLRQVTVSPAATLILAGTKAFLVIWTVFVSAMAGDATTSPTTVVRTINARLMVSPPLSAA
jgi:hypothetical protein